MLRNDCPVGIRVQLSIFSRTCFMFCFTMFRTIIYFHYLNTSKNIQQSKYEQHTQYFDSDYQMENRLYSVCCIFICKYFQLILVVCSRTCSLLYNVVLRRRYPSKRLIGGAYSGICRKLLFRGELSVKIKSTN